LFYLTAADLNHDQRLDLVGAHYSTSGLSVWLARPDGTFSPAVTELPGTQVQAVTTGDYTGDTHPDLVTVNSTGSPLMLLPGRGDGTFLTPLAHNVAGGPGAILAGEFTGDAHLDVVTGNWHHNSVSLYPGNGDGTFQHTAEYATAGGEITTAIKADFNRDGNLDLATLSTDTDVATILLGRGDGTFIEPAQFYHPGVAMLSIAAADLNGDGTLDLVTAGFDEQPSSGGEFAVLLGSGDGTFTNQVSRVAYGNGANSVAVGDFNEDGKPDLVLVYYYEGKVSILEGTGTGTFNLKTNYLTSGGAEKVFTGDFNGDTHTDVLVGSGNALVILPGKGDGSFGESSMYSAPGFHVMALGDINGDHHTDAATGWFDDTCVTLFVGNADGSFVNWTNYCQGNGADSVLLHDINGDGSLDLLVGNYYFSSAHAGIGNGTFGEQVVLPIEGPILEVGDYNNDRKPDLVVARGNQVGVVLNRSVPVLHVESDGDQVRLSWPDWPGYVLESSTNVFLSSSAVTNPPVKIGNQNVVSTSASTTTTLYRLTTDPLDR
jgi:hypothetical protein